MKETPMILPLTYAPNWIRSAAWTIFAALAAAMILVPLKTWANPQLCTLYSDYSLTAAALAKQERAGKLERAAADAILADIYVLPDEIPLQVRVEMEAAFDRLRRAAATARLEPDPYAIRMLRQCHKAGGDLDLFLGVDS